MDTIHLARPLATASLTAVTLLSSLLALPALAADPGLTLTITSSENTTLATVVLHCPPGADPQHPRATEACRNLSSADGDLNALPVEDRACTMEYAPVTASASGAWKGRPLEWRKTFGNSCALQAATGPVFNF